ncbi:mycothiol synthase [Nocardioides sp. YIM 152315]|uniref:mycothiol synthase n=1 Tax=Nocardioides sp. YIM 152315 TaxID=3031760 RepID=UPI0023DACB91|nr:mycothiol synthase [Nocardioides sp. YIM 152315]MDF1605004.1 mycothiol synthase [Nocardioides sp. YIM 152315]
MPDLDALATITAEAEEADGAAPLDAAAWRALRHRPDSVRSRVDDDGFALLIGTELGLVVRPAARGHGLGGRLLGEALAAYGAGPLSAWSHGDHPAAARLAQRHGFDRVRSLWVMRRAAALPLPELVVPDGLTIRGYTPADADEVIRVNAAAFAHHPEQGAMDATELAERMAEPWFDPAGLLLGRDGDRLAAFHWTKQHSADLGEVYVVGVDPAAQGRGLGKVMTLAGLHHLARLGVDEILLYVESDNAPAVAVYSGLGFTHADADTHVMYRRG